MNEINFLKEIKTFTPNLELVLLNVTFTNELTIHGTKRKKLAFGGARSPCDSFQDT